jgi:4-amino-4-deoxy-L-arabinose transferase-like glycosyltransferase
MPEHCPKTALPVDDSHHRQFAGNRHCGYNRPNGPSLDAVTMSADAVTMPASTDAVGRSPRAAFAAFLGLHFVVWTLLPTLLYANLPLDLIEALTYGREWQLGYDKLPPLPWWLVEIMYRLFGTDAAYYALAQVAVLIAFAAVFFTALPLLGGRAALAGILIIDGLHYFQFTSVKFNHDVVQLPLWGLAGYAFHAGLKRGSNWHWALLGFAVGLALWAKYFVVVLAAPLGLFLLIDPDARRSLAKPGPWIAAAVALAVMAPHLVWLFRNDFLPFAYADMRAAPAGGLLDHVVHPLVFLGGQIFFFLPGLLIAAPLWWPPPPAAGTAPPADAFDRRIVTLLAFGPAATVLVLALATGRGTVAMWGYPLWLFVGVWIVLIFWRALDRARMTRIVTLWALVFALFVAAFVADYLVLPPFDHRYRAALFPGDALAAELDQRFRAATGRPLAYVVGSMWNGGNVAHYSPERPQPRVLIDGLPRRAPWIDLADLKAKGAVVVWTEGDLGTVPESFAPVAAGAEPGTPFDLPFRRGGNVVHVGWAVLNPSP